MASSPNEPIYANAVTSDISESDRYRLLSDERRRVTLDVLANRSTPIDLWDVAFDVASREQDVADPDERTVERVAVSLHHHHLPKMTDFGVIEYDTTSNRIV